MQRHVKINNLNNKIKLEKVAIDKFMLLSSCEAIIQKLKVAMSNPSSADAEEIADKILPILASTSKNTIYGSIERLKCISEIGGICKRRGLPGIFATIAPDDINSLNVLRITFRRNSNEEFPATVSDEAVDDFAKGRHALNEGEIEMSSSFQDKAKGAASNPFAAANGCRIFLTDLIEYLLQFPPS